MSFDQLEFQAGQADQPIGKSQNELLRDYLLARPGMPVALPVLAKVITPTGLGAAVHSRVNDCRKKYGMNIVNTVRRRRGKSLSLYTYEPSGIEAQN